MSSFLVGKTTINRILERLRYDGWARDRVRQEWGIDLGSNLGLKAFGQKLVALNLKALKQRYGTLDPSETKTKHSWQLEPCSGLQSVKSLECWRYQCSEGNVPNTKLFKFMSAVLMGWYRSEIDALPGYKAADWG